MSQPVAPSRKPPQRKKLSRGCAVWLIILAILILLTPLTLYERENNIPNPFWGFFNGAYTYTPEKGPPDPSLLDSRPEDALLAFLHDYIKAAGTYPCAQDLSNWQEIENTNDQVWKPTHCTVTRPVANIDILSVHIYHGFIETGPEADVTYRIAYMDGETLNQVFYMTPDKWESYGFGFAYTHEDCWESPAFSLLYPEVVSKVPPHIGYYVYDTGSTCSQ